MRKTVLAAGVVTLALAGCTGYNEQDTVRSTAKGGLIGGGVGLVAGALNGKPVKGAAHGVVIGAAAGALVDVADQMIYGGRGGSSSGYSQNAYPDDGGYVDPNYAGGYPAPGQGGYYPAQGQGGYYPAQATGPEIDPRTGYRLPPPQYRRY